MIRTLTLAGAAALALATAASAQPMNGTPMNGGPMGGPPHQDRGMEGPMMGGALHSHEYIDIAGRTDMFEIAEAKMALHRTSNPHVREFAQMMIHDHMDSTRMIQHAVARSGRPVPAPPQLAPEQQGMIDHLRDSGPNFDRVYIDQQVRAHEKALQVHQAYAQGGDNPELKHAAERIVPVVQHHLEMARGIQGHLG